jgi:hypothetical protein
MLFPNSSGGGQAIITEKYRSLGCLEPVRKAGQGLPKLTVTPAEVLGAKPKVSG